MNTTPKISVLMPIYNTHPDHLRESVSSILGQTFTDFEFLILNDSPDNTELDAIISSFRDSRIRYVRNEYNMGISAARNKLLDMARGEYVAVMDHDDISLPERFAQEVAYLDSHPEVGVCSCRAKYIPSGEIFPGKLSNAEVKKQLMGGCPLMHPAAMLRVSVLKKRSEIKYEEAYTPAEDYRLFLRLIEHTQFHIIPQILFKYRCHADNTSKTKEELMASATEDLQIWIRNKYPVLYKEFLLDCPLKIHVRLFHVIPFLKIIKTRGRTAIFLFDKIPLFNYRERRSGWTQ